ncbi:AAA family ATPase [Lactococcus kimchii]|uniref:AAA family ATPase n=1 Tax=Lactococcus sp. S-13 TaxID=2507158 RepID=UPI00102356FE|nr:SMC family ATPase [Lactococcus sp. S-13]RZI48196.1 SMC family ATPase [Lactococcus sp. S-13]
MKPLYLEMNYFGPHEHSVIDFSRLDEAPIFLISGDTGAGKSTIFDAMTYALFGSTTSEREAKEMRSQFANPSQKTSVTFYFEQGNFIYKIKRCPDQEVKKQRGEGTKLEKSSAQLAVVESVSGPETKNLASKPSDVATEIGNLLNLNAEQFKKIVLLPQNDFSKFLKSKTDEKEAILKKIFGTALFTNFSHEIKEHYHDVIERNKQFANALELQYHSQIWTKEEQEKLEASPEADKFTLVTSFQKNRVQEKKHQEEKLLRLKEEKDKAEASYQKALEISQKFALKSRYEKEYQEKISEQNDQFTKNNQHLKELKWAKTFGETLTQLENSQNAQLIHKATKKKYEEEVRREKEKISQAQATVETLQTQNDKFLKIKAEIDQLTLQIPQAQEAEQLLRAIEVLQTQKSAGEEELLQAKKDQEHIQASISKQKQEIINKETLEKAKAEVLDLQLKFNKNLLPIASELTRLSKESKGLKEELVQAELEEKKALQDLQNKQEDYQLKIKNRRKLMIAQLQKELVAGEPCQVCGATEHLLIHPVEVSDETLKQAIDEVDQSQKDFATAQARYSHALKNKTDLQEKQKAKTEEIKQKQADLSRSYHTFCSGKNFVFPLDFDEKSIENQLQKELRAISDQEVLNKARQNQIEILQKQLHEEVEKEIQKISLQLTEINSKIEVQKKSLDSKKAFVSSENLKARKRDLNEELDSYLRAVEEGRQELTELEKLHERTQAKLEELEEQIKRADQTISNCQSEIAQKMAASAALSQDLELIKNWLSEDLEDLSNQIQTYQQDKVRIESEIQKLEEALKDCEPPELEKLKVYKDNRDTEHLKAAQLFSLSEEAVERVNHLHEKLKKILAKQGNLATETEEITKLWNAINGKTLDKLKLETFVVQTYLEKVLEYANNHFINLLSNHRYQFELSETVKGNGSQGLAINIYDNETGATRSSNTLSGGETFIAALSIALSLSEVVQNSTNAVQIDALFVDEGFGSLDHETLQKAMTALEQIGENRMVGVISHVEAMKKSIGQQLLITKIGDGRSKVELINR